MKKMDGKIRTGWTEKSPFLTPSFLSLHSQGKLAKPATAVSLAVAVALTAKMGARYQETKEAVPALAVAAPSALMVAFYVWSLVAGPVPGGKGKGGKTGVRRSGRTPTKRKVK